MFRKYGITEKQYQAMWDAQKGLCAMCDEPETALDHRTKQPRRLAVDHNHETGKLGKLLCYRCNVALGLLQDSAELLKRGVEYVEKYR